MPVLSLFRKSLNNIRSLRLKTVLVFEEWTITIGDNWNVYCDNLCIARNKKEFLLLRRCVSRHIMHQNCHSPRCMVILDPRTKNRVTVDRHKVIGFLNFLANANIYYRYLTASSEAGGSLVTQYDWQSTSGIHLN